MLNSRLRYPPRGGYDVFCFKKRQLVTEIVINCSFGDRFFYFGLFEWRMFEIFDVIRRISTLMKAS